MLFGCRCFSLVLSLAVIQTGLQQCHFLRIISFRTSDSPYYRFEMTMHDNKTLSSVTRVLKAVPIPTWNLILVQHNPVRGESKIEPPKTLYNSTYKVCEFFRYVKRIPVFHNIVQLLLMNNTSNMSLACPLAKGTYVMRNIHVPPDTGILKFMYTPNTLYTMWGFVLSQKRDKKLEKMCHYEINATVDKKC